MIFIYVFILFSFGNLLHSAEKADLTIYSSRKEQLLVEVVKAYEVKTGKKIHVVYDSEGPLLEKLKAEGSNTEADLILTVDAGNLWKAAELDLLTPVNSKKIEQMVPSNLRDPQKRWFALTRRVRAIVYNPSKVKKDELSTYEDLAQPKWKGRLCLRSSSKVYNQSLIALMIERLGEEKTTEIVQGWVNNLAVKVFSDDTSLIKSIENGPCHIGIANNYYWGMLAKDKPNYNVNIFWPNQKTSGAHVNISGIGVTKFSKNKKNAVEFIEWAISDEAQKLFSDVNLEFPLREKKSVPIHPILAELGKFQSEKINLSVAGKRQQQAVMLMDKAGYK
jgi:iron(III) transport system substrate-binding protein